MILCIDMGNTSTFVGCLEKKRIVFAERFPTSREKTDLEYYFDLEEIFTAHKILPSDLEGAILSSVVPEIRDILLRALKRFSDIKVLQVSADLKRSFTILLDNERELGSSLIALTEGALLEARTPVVIVRTGTATTISVINEKKEYVGGLILPGMQASLKALTDKTGLPYSLVKASDNTFPMDTYSCMNTGALLGNAGMIEGVLLRILKSYPDAVILAAGRQAEILSGYIHLPLIYDETLVLKGLFQLYEENI